MEKQNNDSRLLALSGSIYGIIYQNGENGYTVLEIDAGDDIYTACGICPTACEGEEITLYGAWSHHRDFGRQFKFERFEKHLPATEAAILKYLCSGAVKGIGPITAARIVEAFGTDTFEVLENKPHWLASVKGLSLSKAEKISEEFKAVAGIRNVMMFFRDYVSAAVSLRIYNKWGSGAVKLIKENPYLLCEHIRGVGFEKADEIARAVGADRGSFERICAGVCYILKYNANQNGHTCMPQTQLACEASELLGHGEAVILAAVERMCAGGTLISEKKGKEKYVFLPRLYRAEEYIAKKLCHLKRTASEMTAGDCARLIEKTELTEGIKYEGLQRKAIFEAMSSGVFILTGGPGTGKTTVIKALIGIFDSMGMRVSLCAPTGRAAKRMSEATSHEAFTVHRLLEMEYTDGEEARFIRCADNLLDSDVIIVDEASMLDVLLAESLLLATRAGARVIFIGDRNQLPSVSAGNVLADIISSGAFGCVSLEKIFRQAEESLIVTNAHAINRGEMPDISRNDSDFFFLRRESDEEIARCVCELCSVRLPRKYGEAAKSGLQVISPSRKGAAGTVNLNLMLKDALNPPHPDKRELSRRGIIYREGDRVMQTRNNYELIWEKENGEEGNGIFNGDIGTIVTIEHSREYMTIAFDEREVKYDFSLLEELEHAYAITVHKSQGSEYPTVVIPIYSCPPMLRTRNLLYTALTRAKSMAVLVGREDILNAMVENILQTSRFTGLADMIDNFDKD